MLAVRPLVLQAVPFLRPVSFAVELFMQAVSSLMSPVCEFLVLFAVLGSFQKTLASDYPLKHPVLTVVQQFQSSWSNTEVFDLFLIDYEQTEDSVSLFYTEISLFSTICEFFYSVHFYNFFVKNSAVAVLCVYLWLFIPLVCVSVSV